MKPQVSAFLSRLTIWSERHSSVQKLNFNLNNHGVLNLKCIAVTPIVDLVNPPNLLCLLF